MAIADTDLEVIGCANHAETDSATQGGAIAKGKKINMTNITANDKIEILSSSASDVDQQYDIVGKDAVGADLTENLLVTGVTPVVTAGTYERVNKVVKTVGSALVGTITIRNDAASETVGTLEPAASSVSGVDVDEIRKLYIGLVVPGTTDAFYEKVFFYNGHATLTLTSAVIRLSDASDPAGTDLKVALAATLDDTATTTNRLTTPGLSFVDNQIDVNVANSQNHTAGAGQGVWIENTVSDTALAQKALFNLRESGRTI